MNTQCCKKTFNLHPGYKIIMANAIIHSIKSEHILNVKSKLMKKVKLGHHFAQNKKIVCS